MTVLTNVKREEIEKLVHSNSQYKFVQEEIKTGYEEIRLRTSQVNLILYTSGKLLLQGKPEAVEKIAKLLAKLGIGKKAESEHFRKETGWIIGSDESLKGDTFGGIVVAAVKADDKIRQQLLELGVADSKTLNDKEIFNLFEKIKALAPCEIKSLLPEEYNQEYHHRRNVTEILNKLHQDCAHYLLPGKHVVDKYPGCTVGDIQEEKAESKYAEVAAASILARAAALKQLSYLSTLAGFTLPKGSTHVQEALQELKDRNLDFKKFVKVDFKNVSEFLKKNSGTFQKT